MAASSRLGVLMKLDKNQRKPRVFKASDLCPYYNRRVDPSDNSGCFHDFGILSDLNMRTAACRAVTRGVRRGVARGFHRRLCAVWVLFEKTTKIIPLSVYFCEELQNTWPWEGLTSQR